MLVNYILLNFYCLMFQLLDPLKVPPVVVSSNNIFLVIVEKNAIFFIAACTEEGMKFLPIIHFHSAPSAYHRIFKQSNLHLRRLFWKCRRIYDC